MDEFGQFLSKNGMLIVVVGGVGLGLVLLAAHGSGGASAGGGSTSGTAANSTAAFALAGQQLQSSTQLGLAQINAGVQNTGAAYSFLTSLSNANFAVQQTLINANASVANNQVTNAAAVQIDQANNANRLAIANVNAGVSYAQIGEQSHASDNALAAVRVQSSAQQNIAAMAADVAKAQSGNSLLSSIFGDITKVATVAAPMVF